MLWTYIPHWFTTKYKGSFVEFPKYTDACYQDPSWGVNPDKKYDCGKPRGPLHKAAWSGGADKWPGGYAVLRNLNFGPDEYARLISEVSLENRDAQAVAEEWLKKNEGVWKDWLPSN